MRTLALVIAIAAVVALAAPANQAWAQGKGVEDTPSAQPSDTPSARPSDRPGGAPGAGIGGRSSPAEPEPPPVMRDQPPVVRDEPPAPPERWNSAAAAIWHVRGRVRVAIGYSGVRSSAEDAKSSALEACRNAGGSGCKALGAWNAGCLYITTGHAVSRAGWASGATTDAALKKCRGDGFTCKPPIGGCLD
jgi:Domain of unknown function (DUF4189)